jgi:NitT/TauT family transport system permease protein
MATETDLPSPAGDGGLAADPRTLPAAKTPAAVPGARPRPAALTRLRGLRKLIVPLAALALWQFASTTRLVDPRFLPAPTTVVEAWWVWMTGERSPLAWYSGTWVEYLLLSTRRVLAGFACATLVGVTVGVLIGWSRLVADLVDPLVQLVRPIPMTAWLPFATLLFGIQDTAAVFLIAMGAFFPIVVNSTAGAQRTPRILLRAALMLGTRTHQLLYRVVLPAAMPSIFTGLRLGLGIAWVLVIVSEMLAVKGGLGYALWTAYQFQRMDLIIAAMLSVGGLGYLFDRVLVAIAGRTLRWAQGL